MPTTEINRMPGRAMAQAGRFVVIHPLDDVPEQKVDTSTLGPMPMTWTVRLSLMSLRAYLLLMFGLVVYHVLGLAGLFTWHLR
jgi:hypothetical protein